MASVLLLWTSTAASAAVASAPAASSEEPAAPSLVVDLGFRDGCLILLWMWPTVCAVSGYTPRWQIEACVPAPATLVWHMTSPSRQASGVMALDPADGPEGACRLVQGSSGVVIPHNAAALHVTLTVEGHDPVSVTEVRHHGLVSHVLDL